MSPALARGYQAITRGDAALAEQIARQALFVSSTDADALRLLAMVHRSRNRLREATEAIDRAVAARPGDPMLMGEQGLIQLLAGRIQDAIATLKASAQMLPNNPMALYFLGRAYISAFEAVPAIKVLTAASKLAPTNHEITLQLGVAHLHRGLFGRALQLIESALASRPNDPSALHYHGTALRLARRYADAKAAYQKALAVKPDDVSSCIGLAQILEQEGDFDGAARLLESQRAIGPRTPGFATAYARVVARLGRNDDAKSMLEAEIARSEGMAVQHRTAALFALGSMLESEKDFDRAFECFRRANDLTPRTFKPEQARSLTDRIIQTFSAARHATMPRASNASELPVFIVGMPRSGTSLVEQIVASHPRVIGAGELNYVPLISHQIGQSLPDKPKFPESMLALTPALVNEFADRHLEQLREIGGEADRVTDKMPHNFRNLGLIRLLFPRARVIHCRRNPIDVCTSCYTVQFSPVHNYSNRLDDLVVEYAEYRRLMRHWRATLTDLPMLDLPYEELTRDQEGWTRRLLDFCGLEWDERCLRFYENARVMDTASMDQVRKPLYHSSVARYKRYEKHLGPLIEGLKPYMDEYAGT
ncbi:MAG: sulfotransferase [Phycisphaerae bacterium]|nr:sulfotransferase [Phycisphaerae bacterium]